MTLQDVKENLQKQVKRHFQCGADPTMIRAWSENDPSMIREWSENENANRNPPRKWGYFRAHHEHFLLKNTTFRAQSYIQTFTKYCACHVKCHLNFTKYCACHEKWHLNFTKYCACHEKWHLNFTKYCAGHCSVTELYCTLLYLTLLYVTLLYVTLLYVTLLYLTLLYLTLLYLTLLDTTLRDTTLRDTTLRDTTLLDSTLLDSTLLDSTWHYSTWHYSTWHYSTWLYSTWLYSTWLYLTLLYVTLLYLAPILLDSTLLDLLHLTLLYWDVVRISEVSQPKLPLINIQYGRSRARILNPAKPRHQHVCISTVPSTEAFRNSKITSMWQSPKTWIWGIVNTCLLKYSLVMNDMNAILYTSGAVMVPCYFHHLSAPPLQNSIIISYGRCNSKILHKRMSTPRLHVFLRCPPRAFAPAHSVAVPRRSVVHTAPANEQSGGAFFLGEELHVCGWFVGER